MLRPTARADRGRRRCTGCSTDTSDSSNWSTTNATRSDTAFWRPVIARTVEKFLACGDLRAGFARVRCPRCRHEFFVAFSCRRRCLCPICHQKRALIIADHIAGDEKDHTWVDADMSPDDTHAADVS